MSENNQNSNELNNVIEEFVENAGVITVPIDDTLSNSGEAADAKAVGDALAEKADRSELQTQVKVNNQSPDSQGLIILLAGHIPVSEAQGAQNVAQVLNTLGLKTGADIKVNGETGAPTVAAAIESIDQKTADDIPMESGNQESIADAMEEIGDAVEEISQEIGDEMDETDVDAVFAEAFPEDEEEEE